MATTYTPEPTGSGLRAHIQRLGGKMAGMVMPNIGAFIAWGLITALFIPTGWLPNKDLGELVDPMIKFLLPLLIGYTGGRMVHGQRGAVVGAVATVGIIVGADVPMFLGAMMIGPLTAYLLKLFDDLVQDRVRTGFEMLVDNFSAGIIGGAMAVAGNRVIGPVMNTFSDWAGDGVGWLVDHDVLPLTSLLIEPAKVLFLNNAVNHGVLGPLGVQQAAEHGKSVLFMLESNPGPGLGVLLAYWFFGPRRLRPSVPAAAIIHFFGGIHEIYFPYILMKPRMILAAMAGGVTGVAIFVAFDTGLVATPSPGSIFAYLAQTPRGASNWIGVYTGLLASTAVSFGVGAALLGFGRLAEPATDGDPEGAEEQDGTATAETAGDETAENETAKDEAAKSEAPKDAGDGAAKETTAH
ncbi:PTS mannitol transporter subunit IICB [Actinomadura madurae]|uniref:PTS mannitol transporter subunit IICB n=2 Tax=Actinomadura madurae TaxID=1993 RepID=UPI0020273EB4|nr:PTS mannitol transporter subunit IICB [Actinomadura madurae]MCP9947123.1 PTS mannitol transporter subunit IICB [Actinomadura madurae]MCP9963883.1 PTS mannitol transporter subunit IICB [Actinomadura madurae]MCP9976362.1 PTS mannitol transporter subunit IICB [Actinomadura madurae]MCQ0012147.1 PTS mannitol transporter subunit IICB [Actinomadura madurae]URM92973.1 PTS mannitol transporter subunit IICB [Actinomadura madurae]